MWKAEFRYIVSWDPLPLNPGIRQIGLVPLGFCASLNVRVAEEPVHRIGRWPDPWQPPDWAHAHLDGTFGNRFDDPQAYYRVIYTSSQRLGCFLETLARFRPDLTLLADLAEIEGEDDFTPLATVPASWLVARLIGTAQTEGEYADVYAPGWNRIPAPLSSHPPQWRSAFQRSTPLRCRPAARAQLTQEASLISSSAAASTASSTALATATPLRTGRSSSPFPCATPQPAPSPQMIPICSPRCDSTASP